MTSGHMGSVNDSDECLLLGGSLLIRVSGELDDWLDGVLSGTCELRGLMGSSGSSVMVNRRFLIEWFLDKLESFVGAWLVG